MKRKRCARTDACPNEYLSPIKMARKGNLFNQYRQYISTKYNEPWEYVGVGFGNRSGEAGWKIYCP
jgi:hypothetical protein